MEIMYRLILIDTKWSGQWEKFPYAPVSKMPQIQLNKTLQDNGTGHHSKQWQLKDIGTRGVRGVCAQTGGGSEQGIMVGEILTKGWMHNSFSQW